MSKHPHKPKPDLQRLFDLQHFLHKFHAIERIVYLPGKNPRYETDTEHTFTLAMTAWFLAQYFDDIDTDKCIKLALVHDLVEIYAGDTYAFADKAVLDSKTAREAKALGQITKEWQDFPDMVQAIEDYEKLNSKESKFVFALDKIMPPLVIFMGEGYTWQKHKITFAMHHEVKIESVAQSAAILDYYNQLVELMQKNLDYFHLED
ncbi:MAG TPA: HD domain-containing protein [Patescibacteria group bacterium]|nr:HD domain-containing protein [Patescibacteria group bacterium]